jgi:hypothetical protein
VRSDRIRITSRVEHKSVGRTRAQRLPRLQPLIELDGIIIDSVVRIGAGAGGVELATSPLRRLQQSAGVDGWRDLLPASSAVCARTNLDDTERAGSDLQMCRNKAELERVSLR